MSGDGPGAPAADVFGLRPSRRSGPCRRLEVAAVDELCFGDPTSSPGDRQKAYRMRSQGACVSTRARSVASASALTWLR
ncbi:hypothetical protein SUDANB6_05670 [Streptomyces sp. enrichment culture]